MSASKIKLQSSLNAINAKATTGKRKGLPKLKVILANPYKPLNEKLSLLETCELKAAMNYEVIASGLNPREYVKENKICLGLHSALRAITELRTSCVLVSETIKPKYIINQIVLYAKQKNFLVPSFVVNNLGTLSESIYGTRALVIAFPLKLPNRISEWVMERYQQRQELHEKKKKKSKVSLKKAPENRKKPLELSCVYINKKEDGKRGFVPPVVVDKVKSKPTIEIKQWSGDYISFSKTPGSKAKINESEKERVLTALHSLTGGIKAKDSVNELRMRGDGQNLKENVKKLPKIVYEENDDADFEKPHKKLRVHRIQRNPNRKQKKDN